MRRSKGGPGHAIRGDQRPHTVVLHRRRGGQARRLRSSAWLNSRMWDFQIAYFVRQGLRCIAYDRRGQAGPMAMHGYDYDTFADDLAALARTARPPRRFLVAPLEGGGEIVRYLTRHGGGWPVERIVLIRRRPFPMKTVDNPDGIDRGVDGGRLGRGGRPAPVVRRQRRQFFGIGLPVWCLTESSQFMIRQCLDCSARRHEAFFITGFARTCGRSFEGLAVTLLSSTVTVTSRRRCDLWSQDRELCRPHLACTRMPPMACSSHTPIA